ncbi:MAG TPA: HEAT repeat domain-containing protein [Clostridia bacterium]|nr:HEAT repeat domain-containing protein [Clostridia bacterium]
MFGSKTDKIKGLAEKKKGGKIAGFLNDRSKEVVMAAIEGLGACGGEDAVNGLVPLLRSTDAAIRIATANAMATMGDPRTKAHLDFQLKHETDPKVKDAIVHALGSIRSKD